jgi:hypothetical protein
MAQLGFERLKICHASARKCGTSVQTCNFAIADVFGDEAEELNGMIRCCHGRIRGREAFPARHTNTI